MKKLLILLPAALTLFGCGTEKGNEIPPIADKPPAASQGPTGRIRGVVQLKGDAPTPTFEPVDENQSVCGERVPLSRLALGKGKGVQYRLFISMEFQAPRSRVHGSRCWWIRKIASTHRTL